MFILNPAIDHVLLSTESMSFLQAGLLTLLPCQQPSHSDVSEQWHTWPTGFLLPIAKGRITAAGPSLNLTGFPIIRSKTHDQII